MTTTPFTETRGTERSRNLPEVTQQLVSETGINLRPCSPRAKAASQQDGVSPQSYRMGPQDLGPTDEAKGKDGGHPVSLLPPRLLSEHQLQYTSWQNTARAMLAAPEAGKRRMAEREGKKMRNGFGEKKCTRQMVLGDTLPAVEPQRERAKPRRNVRVSLQLSHPGHALGRCREHDIDSVAQGSLSSVRTWEEPPKEGIPRSPGGAPGPKLSSSALQRKQGKIAVQSYLDSTQHRVTSHLNNQRWLPERGSL